MSNLWSVIKTVVETGVETESIDLKRECDLSNRSKRADFAKDVAVMANTGRPGYLVLGVLDAKERSEAGADYIVGFEPENLDQFLKDVYETLAFYLEPAPKVEYHTLLPAVTRNSIGVVEVMASGARPHAFKRAGAGVEEAEIWIRSGPACRRASLREIEEMIRGQTRVILINFTHPLPDEQKEKARLLMNARIEEVRQVAVQFNEEKPFAAEIEALVDRVGLTQYQWQTCPVVIIPPGYAPIAMPLVAELHGRMGHFPTMIRLRPIRAGGTTTYEVAEVLDLQAIRDQARVKR